MNTKQSGSPPGLLRADAAARLLGMGVDAFCSACKREQIPVELLQLGGRGTRYVRTHEFCTFMRLSADQLTITT